MKRARRIARSVPSLEIRAAPARLVGAMPPEMVRVADTISEILAGTRGSSTPAAFDFRAAQSDEMIRCNGRRRLVIAHDEQFFTWRYSTREEPS
jgi:hypothetical protein